MQPLVHQLERVESLAAIARTDLALLRLAGEPASASEQEFLGRLTLQTLGGGAGGLLLLGLLVLGSGGLKAAPMVVLLPAAFALLVPAWSWLTLGRRAGRLRASSIEYRLPRLLVAARVLLESGAATPAGALTHAVTIYKKPPRTSSARRCGSKRCAGSNEPGGGAVQVTARRNGNLVVVDARGTAPALLPVPPYRALPISSHAVHTIEQFEPGSTS